MLGRITAIHEDDAYFDDDEVQVGDIIDASQLHPNREREFLGWYSGDFFLITDPEEEPHYCLAIQFEPYLEAK